MNPFIITLAIRPFLVSSDEIRVIQILEENPLSCNNWVEIRTLIRYA
jgi:hypothetical protein